MLLKRVELALRAVIAGHLMWWTTCLFLTCDRGRDVCRGVSPPHNCPKRAESEANRLFVPRCTTSTRNTREKRFIMRPVGNSAYCTSLP